MNRPAVLRCRAAAGASARPPKVSSSKLSKPLCPVAIAPMVSKREARAVRPHLPQQQQQRLLLASPPTAVAAAAASSSSPGGDKTPVKTGFVADRVAELKAVATPFSDPVSNGRLVALCLAQMLCSVATLIHDT